jgi:hypothetical protein
MPQGDRVFGNLPVHENLMRPPSLFNCQLKSVFPQLIGPVNRAMVERIYVQPEEIRIIYLACFIFLQKKCHKVF